MPHYGCIVQCASRWKPLTMRFPFAADSSPVSAHTQSGNNSFITDNSSAQCPVRPTTPTRSGFASSMEQLTGSKDDQRVARCPVAHAPDAINPHNNMPVLDQLPLPTQTSHLPTSRVTSSIPRSSTSCYPGEKDTHQDGGMIHPFGPIG